jgi:cobalt/nickel transport system ATP-binding protein
LIARAALPRGNELPHYEHGHFPLPMKHSEDGVAISATALTFAYPGGPLALDGVSLRVASGENVGLVGPNGAGKTTLFLCLAGVVKLRPGMARLDGLDPAVPDERRRLPARVGIVFQHSDDQLFNTTVFDDVAFGPLNLSLPADEVRRRVAEALARVGLTGFEQRVPFHLSGGEKRRAALAGVLAMQPGILLLDEPSMFLDARGRRELILLLQQLPVTKVIASHDLELILEICSRVLLLDKGRLIDDRPARALLGDAALMERHGLEVPHSLRRG